MIRPDCRLSAKPSALSRHRYFVSHCAPSNYKKVVSADTPNPCTQPTRHSCNNLISNLLQSPGVGRHHTNLHSADTGMIVTKLYSPRSTSPRFTLLHFISSRFSSPRSTSPRFTSPRSTSPRSTSPRSSSPRFSSPRFSSPHLAPPHLAPPRLASPHLASPHLTSPRFSSPRLAPPHLAFLSHRPTTKQAPGNIPEGLRFMIIFLDCQIRELDQQLREPYRGRCL